MLPQLQLDKQLCFMFQRISRELTAAYRPLLADLGLTYPQYLVMLVLWESEELTVGQIGHRLALDSATLSPLLRRLADAGLVERERDADDERRVNIRLTAQGRELEDRAAQIPGAMAGHLVSSEADYRQLHALLQDLLRRIPTGAGGGI